MESITEKVIGTLFYCPWKLNFRPDRAWTRQRVECQSVSPGSSYRPFERVGRAPDVVHQQDRQSLGRLNRSITLFPSLVFALLEVLTILCKACDNEHYDEVRLMLPTLRV